MDEWRGNRNFAAEKGRGWRGNGAERKPKMTLFGFQK
jgi:hypothetical protein